MIFTFLISHALYLEVASHLNTDARINALYRFICRRGSVKTIRSDPWERLIRLVKRVLYSVLKEQTLNDDAPHIALCEVEAITNDRSITMVTNDPNNLEPLTSNHLLQLKTNTIMPPGLFHREDLYSQKRWRQVQCLADLFWKRETREYLPLTQEGHKWKQNFTPGDFVVIIDCNAPRNSWHSVSV